MDEKASFLRSFFAVFVIFFMQELFENALHLSQTLQVLFNALG